MMYTLAFTLCSLLVAYFSVGVLDIFSKVSSKGPENFPAIPVANFQPVVREAILINQSETELEDLGVELERETSILEFPVFLN